jgi:hypothetical protein
VNSFILKKEEEEANKTNTYAYILASSGSNEKAPVSSTKQTTSELTEIKSLAIGRCINQSQKLKFICVSLLFCFFFSTSSPLNFWRH